MAEHNHEHEHHHHEMPQKSHIEEALGKYNLDITDEEVKEAVKKIIAEKVHENDTLEVKQFLMGSVELTTLKTTDSDESVMAFTERVNQFEAEYPNLPHVATICVYPRFAKTVAETLEVDGVEIACVSGSFPSSQALIEVKTVETALALKDGATEIDMVMSVGAFLSGDYETVCDEIQQMKETCGEQKMKVILETGCLKTAKNIKTASILAMYAGADYIKTSTGKIAVSATLEASEIMLNTIKKHHEEAGKWVGFKAAGGISTPEQVLKYYLLAEQILGKEQITNQFFRVGASRLTERLFSFLTDENFVK